MLISKARMLWNKTFQFTSTIYRKPGIHQSFKFLPPRWLWLQHQMSCKEFHMSFLLQSEKIPHPKQIFVSNVANSSTIFLSKLQHININGTERCKTTASSSTMTMASIASTIVWLMCEKHYQCILPSWWRNACNNKPRTTQEKIKLLKW